MTERDNGDRFDEALEEVRATELGEEPAAPAPEPGEPAAPPPARGRKHRRGRGGKRQQTPAQREAALANLRKGRERAAGGSTAPAASAPIQDPPTPPVPPIDPAKVALAIRQLDSILAKFAGTTPLTDGEVKDGGVVWAPIFDHYFPRFAADAGIWTAPVLWTLGTYGPRVYDLVERYRRERAAKLLEARRAAGDTSADNGGAASPLPPNVDAVALSRGVVQ